MLQSIFSLFPRLPDKQSAKGIQPKSTCIGAHTTQYGSNQIEKSKVNAFWLKFFSKT